MKQTGSKQASRPRNYLARHPIMKKGGFHEKPEKAKRKAAKQALRNVDTHKYPDESFAPVGSAFASVFVSNFWKRTLA